MQPISELLIPGEEILYQSDVHWIELVKPVLALVFGPLLVGYLPVGAVYFAGFIMVGSAAWIVYNLITSYTIKFIITNQRLIATGGLSRQITAAWSLGDIAQVIVKQALPADLFGYGDLIVEQLDGNRGKLKSVPHPEAFREVLEQQIDGVQHP